MTEQQRSALGEAVQQARTEQGWSKEEAARRAGISSITWKRIEDGLKVHDGKLSAVLRSLSIDETGNAAPSVAIPEGARIVGDPSEGLVEFSVSGNFGVTATVKGPVSDMAALQAAVSHLIADMQTNSDTREVP